MIFAHTWEQVIAGTKTQTRRIIKPATGEGKSGEAMIRYPGGVKALSYIDKNGNWHIKWQVGKTYAIQPGYGKPAVEHGGIPYRIRIQDLREERVQDIIEEDAIAEGAPAELPGLKQSDIARTWYRELWSLMYTRPGSRWEDNPTVCVIEFVLVK